MKRVCGETEIGNIMSNVDITTEVIVTVKLTGRPTSEIMQTIKDGIQDQLKSTSDISLLLDFRDIQIAESGEFVQVTKDFVDSISERVRKVAALIPDYLVKTRLGLVFVNINEYEIFYDLAAAKTWLKS